MEAGVPMRQTSMESSRSVALERSAKTGCAEQWHFTWKYSKKMAPGYQRRPAQLGTSLPEPFWGAFRGYGWRMFWTGER